MVRRASPWGEGSQRKDPAGVGQVVVAGATVIVNGNAGFGEQGKVPVESAEAAPAGIGKGVSSKRLGVGTCDQGDDLEQPGEFGEGIGGPCGGQGQDC